MVFSLNSVLVAGVLVGQAVAVNNGLARTPQMGWVSLNERISITLTD